MYLKNLDGKIKGDDKCGGTTELMLYALTLDIQVVVVNGAMLTAKSSGSVDENAFQYLSIVNEEDRKFDAPIPDTQHCPLKSRMVCVIFEPNQEDLEGKIGHYTIACTRNTDGTFKVVFNIRSEWENAKKHITDFIKNKRLRNEALAPQWSTNPQTTTTRAGLAPSNFTSPKGSISYELTLQHFDEADGAILMAGSPEVRQVWSAIGETPNPEKTCGATMFDYAKFAIRTAARELQKKDLTFFITPQPYNCVTQFVNFDQGVFKSESMPECTRPSCATVWLH